MKTLIKTLMGFAALAGLALSVNDAQAQTLVNHYAFNDAGGTVVDSVGGANGTLVGGATESGGRLNTSGTYASNNEAYASLPAYIFGAGPISFEAFATATSYSARGFNTLFSYDNGTTAAGGTSGKAYVIGGFDRNGTIPGTAFSTNGLPDQNVSGGPLPSLNTLHQFVTTFDGTNATQYIDGAEVGTIATSFLPSLIGTTSKAGIGGGSPFEDDAFQGSIQDFRIFNGALTAAQVAADNIGGPDKIVSGAPVPEASTTVSFGLLLALGMGGFGIAKWRMKARKRF